MKTIIIEDACIANIDVLTMYLVGGVDLDRQHIPAINIFRPGLKEELYNVCARAEAGCMHSIRRVENLVVQSLSQALYMMLNGVEYIFDIKRFECQRTIQLLVREVLAQVNEE